MKKNKFLIVLAIIFVLTVAFFTAKWMSETGKKIIARPPVERALKKAPKMAPRPAGAKMAVILDDWGLNTARLEEAIAIGQPLTLSILPHLKYSRDIAKVAKAHGLGVMLHMPMQPKGSHQPMEPHTLLITMSEDEIVTYLEEALASVPEAEGANNHQGSAATSDLRVMRLVLSRLKEKGLFFVDSRVIASSVGSKVAKEVGIRFERRDVFIDNQPVVDAVVEQLREGQRIALTHGRAVVIGHDKKATLEAIRRMVPELKRNGVHLVLVRDLVK